MEWSTVSHYKYKYSLDTFAHKLKREFLRPQVLSMYPYFYKIEGLVDQHGKHFVALSEVSDGWENTPEFRDNNGPNYLFLFETPLVSPGFSTLVAMARDEGIDDWEDLPGAVRINDIEAPVEHNFILSSSGKAVALWKGNMKKVQVIDPAHQTWATR